MLLQVHRLVKEIPLLDQNRVGTNEFTIIAHTASATTAGFAGDHPIQQFTTASKIAVEPHCRRRPFASEASTVMKYSMQRRELLNAAITGLPFAILSSALALPAWAQEAPALANDFWARPRSIRLRRDGQRLESTYWIDGEVQQEAWQEISWFLRDKVENQAVWMQPVLLDILYGVDGWLRYFNISDPVDVTSGHRSARRNAQTEGAAKDSQHISGGATDIRHASVSSEQFARFGQWLGGGGVGWYPSKGFTHVDRGRLRFWKG